MVEAPIGRVASSDRKKASVRFALQRRGFRIGFEQHRAGAAERNCATSRSLPIVFQFKLFRSAREKLTSMLAVQLSQPWNSGTATFGGGGMSKNSSRDWLKHELSLFAAKLKPDSLILDAGAGDQIYAPIFQHIRYESSDFEKVDKVYKKPTYSCDLASIPVEDGRYDAIVCTQVFEHLPEPLAVLKEFHRALRPGGNMIVTCPLWYEEHEKPYDFYRYTQFGLRHMFEKAGFVVDELRWLDGYMASVAHQFRLMKRHLPRRPSDFGGGLQGAVSAATFAVFRLFLWPLSWVANSADRCQRYTAGGLPINYLAIVTKPAPHSENDALNQMSCTGILPSGAPAELGFRAP